MIMSVEFDELDKSILRLLQNDGRLSNKQIAATLNKSQTTIFGRIKKLKRFKAIIKTAAILNGELLGLTIEGYIYLKVLSYSSAQMELFKKNLLQIKGVCRCTSITGQRCLKIKVAVRDTDSFYQIRNAIATLQDVSVEDSYVELKDIIEERGFDF
jgi:Lrp/AsnC family leucine-responsive transcriptional regulator